MEDFPQYRKLANGQSYYKISGPADLTELQRLGRRWLLHQLHAKILPERLLIADLLNLETDAYQRCSADEFEKVLQQHIMN